MGFESCNDNFLLEVGHSKLGILFKAVLTQWALGSKYLQSCFCKIPLKPELMRFLEPYESK